MKLLVKDIYGNIKNNSILIIMELYKYTKYKNKYLKYKKIGGSLTSEIKFNYISNQINFSFKNLFDNELLNKEKLFIYTPDYNSFDTVINCLNTYNPLYEIIYETITNILSNSIKENICNNDYYSILKYELNTQIYFDNNDIINYLINNINKHPLKLLKYQKDKEYPHHRFCVFIIRIIILYLYKNNIIQKEKIIELFKTDEKCYLSYLKTTNDFRIEYFKKLCYDNYKSFFLYKSKKTINYEEINIIKENIIKCKLDTIEKTILNLIIDNIKIVSFDNFLINLINSFYNCINQIDNDYIIIIMIKDKKKITSNIWIPLLLLSLLYIDISLLRKILIDYDNKSILDLVLKLKTKKNPYDIIFVDNTEIFFYDLSIKNIPFIICDDCIYSGNQMNSTIKNYKNLYVCSSYISTYAITRDKLNHINNNRFYGSLIPTINNLLYLFDNDLDYSILNDNIPINSILINLLKKDEDEKLLFINEVNNNNIEIYKSFFKKCQDFEINHSLFIFEHKLADYISIFHDFILGKLWIDNITYNFKPIILECKDLENKDLCMEAFYKYSMKDIDFNLNYIY